MAIFHQIRRAEDAPKPSKPRPAEKIEAGLREALAVAKGEAEPFATHVRRGRKPSDTSKVQVTFRIDPDVIEALKAGGPGWQSRANALLRAALKL